MSRGGNVSDMNKALAETSSGIEMPAVGVRTFRLTNQDLIYRAVNYAFTVGYNISGISRENRITMRYDSEKLMTRRTNITMKETNATANLTLTGNYRTTKSFKRAIQNLGSDFIDLHLIHYHAPPPPLSYTMQTKTWMAVVKLYEESKVRALNVNNFQLRHLIRLTEILSVGPMIRQIDWHPTFFQSNTINYICQHNIRMQSFSSFGGWWSCNRTLIEDARIKEIAIRHKTSYEQVLLVWANHRGFAVMPKATEVFHQMETSSYYFEMTDQEMISLDSLALENKRYD